MRINVPTHVLAPGGKAPNKAAHKKYPRVNPDKPILPQLPEIEPDPLGLTPSWLTTAECVAWLTVRGYVSSRNAVQMARYRGVLPYVVAIGPTTQPTGYTRSDDLEAWILKRIARTKRKGQAKRQRAKRRRRPSPISGKPDAATVLEWNRMQKIKAKEAKARKLRFQAQQSEEADRDQLGGSREE